ncbi:MAG: TerB N-terminal domain-containing protein, partial [Lachnospiraceae bacterium]|nr:TerB N-terminal domain-containing protein [Lachnospiraceae bacterium]
MSFQYTDERIPDRHSRSGRKRRPGQVPRTASDIGRWNMITEEELFGVPSSRRNVQSGEAAGPFAELLRMTARYQVSDEERREAFLEQARKMCDYEEEGYVPDVSYYHAFVGYQEMDAHELHSYFIWRTKQKRSVKVPFNSGFAMLRSAELINLIGVKDMEEAFSQLLSLEYEARSASGKTGTGLTAD